MEYWNVGMSKIRPLAGMISKGSFSFIDFLVNTVLPVGQSPSFPEVNIPLFQHSPAVSGMSEAN